MAIDFGTFRRAERALGDQYGASASRNAYSQFLARTRGNRQIADIGQQYKNRFPGFVSSFQQRGLVGPGVNSGVYQKALSDLARKQFTDVNAAQQSMNQELQQLGLQQKDLEAQYQAQLAELKLKKAQDIAAQAAMLNSFKPFVGG